MKWLALIPEILNRIPLEKLIARPPDNKQRLRELQEILTGAEPKKEAQPEVAKIEEPEEPPLYTRATKTAVAGKGCRACTAKHFAKCAGALSEAIDFARTDGIEGDEVLKRLAFCHGEISSWEGIDATPASFATLSEERKTWVRKWLPEGRRFRHKLDAIKTIEDLEEVAALAETLHFEAYKELKKIGELKDEEEEAHEELASETAA